jgi:hypothetical protein
MSWFERDEPKLTQSQSVPKEWLLPRHCQGHRPSDHHRPPSCPYPTRTGCPSPVADARLPLEALRFCAAATSARCRPEVCHADSQCRGPSQALSSRLTPTSAVSSVFVQQDDFCFHPRVAQCGPSVDLPMDERADPMILPPPSQATGYLWAEEYMWHDTGNAMGWYVPQFMTQLARSAPADPISHNCVWRFYPPLALSGIRLAYGVQWDSTTRRGNTTKTLTPNGACTTCYQYRASSTK